MWSSKDIRDSSWDVDQGIDAVQKGHGKEMAIQEESLKIDLADEEEPFQP